MKPGTYPVELDDPRYPAIGKIPIPIPRKHWEGDWIINMDGDIKFLASHFYANVGDYLWVRETHRFSVKTNATDPDFKEVWVEYKDGNSRKTTILPEEIPHIDRWLPPLAMLRDATRFVLKIKDIESEWANDEKTNLIWVIGVERVVSPEYIIEMDKRGVLK